MQIWGLLSEGGVPFSARSQAMNFCRARQDFMKWVLMCLAVAACLVSCDSARITGLRPEEPFIPIKKWGARCYESPVVDSLQPTLRWVRFPDSSLATRVAEVTYDLRLWRAEEGQPGDLIYERKALPLPIHQIETPLEPATEYFWTVRTRFHFDGRPRVSQWAMLLGGNVGGNQCSYSVPKEMDSYLRFKTP